MNIRYSLKREEVQTIVKNAVIAEYFPEGLPVGMEASVTIENYGTSFIDVFEKEEKTEDETVE